MASTHNHASRPGSSGLFASARGLVLAYDNNVAVTASDVEIPAGKLTAIIGPNGSGKSTLLNAVGGLLRPAAGELTVLGTTATKARPRISYVMQSVNFPEGIPLSVQEIVTMGRYPTAGWFGRLRSADRERVTAAMERLAVTDLAKRHLEELSGGQRQRVYVAQGMAQDHEVLLLDEPMTGLDLVSARTIDGIIHSETESGKTVVHTTHDLDEARAADHVILMSGRVVAYGPPAEVLTQENLREAYNLGQIHDDDHDGPFLDDPHADC